VRIVLQRVERASVRVAGETVSSIGAGLLVLVGVGPDDGRLDLASAARKVLELRVLADAGGKMNLSILDLGLEVLAVSQFTLYGDARKGRRPSYIQAAPPDVAEPVFDNFVAAMRAAGARVSTGRFGAHMAVELVNDGPVTLMLELAPPGDGK
jgi:D-tyrosyl-tRNA(Tyr) deacylase